MSIRNGAPSAVSVDTMLNDAISPAFNDPLGEGNSYVTANPDHPLEREVVVSIKASLNDLCLQKNKATWQPTQEALRSMCKLLPLTTQLALALAPRPT